MLFFVNRLVFKVHKGISDSLENLKNNELHCVNYHTELLNGQFCDPQLKYEYQIFHHKQ